MIVKGKLASWTSSGKRAERRRVVNLAARLNERGTTSADIRAIDVSPVGCLVTPAGAAKVGDIVWLKLPGLEPLRCRVIWVDGNDAGCWFERRLHPAEVERLVADARCKPVKRGDKFGRRTRVVAA